MLHYWRIAFTSVAPLLVLAFLAWAALAVWLFSFPPGLSSDDALYFSRALGRFSILDFSPHFPGYPVFVGLGRLLHLFVQNPIQALQTTTTITALLIPFATAAVIWRASRNITRSLAGFALALCQPILTGLAISGLSDGTGLMFFLFCLAVLVGQDTNAPRPIVGFGAGVLLGLALWARPSYGVIFAPAFLMTLAQPRLFLGMLLGILMISLPCLFVLLSHEGAGYWAEALRFTDGHTRHWGNTAFSQKENTPTWTATFIAHPLLGIIVALYVVCAIGTIGRTRPLLHVCFFVALIWTALMQNPENLRHLAPVMYLGGVLVVLVTGRRAALIAGTFAMLVNIWFVSLTLDPRPTLPAIERVAIALNVSKQRGTVYSNRYNALLRARLDQFRVRPIGGSLPNLHSSSPDIVLSRDPLPNLTVAARLQSRFPGEQNLYVYASPDVFPNLFSRLPTNTVP